MLKLSGKAGDGIGALGLKTLASGRYEIAVIDTVLADEPQLLRKAGLGGCAYTRHCLEAIVLERGGLWPPETVETSLDLLERIDDDKIEAQRFETWTYGDVGGTLSRQAVGAFEARSGTRLQQHAFPEKTITYPAELSRQVERFSDELGRASLQNPWRQRYAETLAEFAAGRAGTGVLLCALLTRQAIAERNLIVESAGTGAFATEAGLELISLRYVRALCQIEISADQPLLRPDLIELGRTILLLVAIGHFHEAQELGMRVAQFVEENPFIPTVPLFGLAWAIGRNDLISADRPSYGTGLPQAFHDFYAAMAASDAVGCGKAIHTVADARRFQIASFSDAYVTDFDDDISWCLPYEAAAMQKLAKRTGIILDAIDHPIMELPTAIFPDLSDLPLRHTELHGLLVKKLRDA